MILEQPNFGLDVDAYNIEVCDLKKQAKYMHCCKNCVWSGWAKEYPRGLRKQHNLVHYSNVVKLKERDFMIIGGNEKYRAHWKTGIFHQLLLDVTASLE